MKKSVFFYTIFTLISFSIYAQCDKVIETNPLNPKNSEFLPLKNTWYPGPNPYTVNSFLNTAINWYPPSSISIDLSDNWSEPFGNLGNLNMTNPYSSDHSTNHINHTPNDDTYKDYRWEDGWELLWINLGKHFNGDPLDDPSNGTYFATGNYTNNPSNPEIFPEIAPSNIPYFVLYNRYRGTLRLFANVWQDNLNPSFERISITMKYDQFSSANQNISGIFRDASQIDRALDQATEFTQIAGPRLQPVNSSDWLVAEFQMAFDPCICMKEFDGNKDPGKIEFVFETIETLKIDLVSRTIQLSETIDSTLVNEDFLNLSMYDSLNYQPGTRMYSSMEDMLTKYQNELNKYSDQLDDYNEYKNDVFVQFLELGKDLVAQGINLSIPAGNAFDSIISENSILSGAFDPDKIVSSTVKGIIGNGSDYASFEFLGKKPTKPVKPTQPVANFSESNYKGKITKTLYQKTPPLIVPGGIDSYEPTPNAYVGYGKMRLSPRIFPAYNKVLGLTALLLKPEPLIYMDSYISTSPPFPNDTAFTDNLRFNLRFDSTLAVAINRSLDIDLEKTTTYVNLELVVQRINLSGSQYELETKTYQSNLFLQHAVDKGMITEYTYVSKWVPLEDLNQYVYSLNVQDIFVSEFADPNAHQELFSYKLKSLKMKLMHDMYFDQIGFWGDQVNTTQIRSYYLFNLSEQPLPIIYLFPLNSNPSAGTFDLYTTGTIELIDQNITINSEYVTQVIGNNIFINAEDVIISGNITVQSGYTLVVQALNSIITKPNANIAPSVHLKIKRDFYDTPIFEYTDNSEVYNFCNNSNQYHANVASKSLSQRIRNNSEMKSDIEKVGTISDKNHVSIHPNPANSQIWITSTSTPISEVQIWDISGRILIHEKSTDSDLHKISVNITSLQTGIYIVQTKCGNERNSQKLVVGK